MLAVVGVVQFPKSDFKAGGFAFCAVVTELVEVVPARLLVMLEKTDGATVELLMDPNTDEVMFEESVEAGFPAVTGEDGKPAPAVVPPKMGLNVWTDGLTSGVDIGEDDVTGVTAKMGLNPEASRGLLLSGAEPPLLEATAETGLEEGAGVVRWAASPKGPEFPAAGAPLDATDTWLGS